MTKSISLFLSTIVFAISAGAQVTMPGAKLTLIDSSFSFTEGPATDEAGNIFFTDQPNDDIWQYDTDGKLSLFMQGAKRSNGMYFDAKGNLISCADENDELIAIDKHKKITVLVNNYKGHILNGPNDVWVNRLTGGIYITDPYYQRNYWSRTKPDAALGGEKLYFLPPGKKELILADSTVVKPNGITGTADGNYLYVADMGVGKTFRYHINADGLLSNKTLFANEASDGMTIDAKGNIYLTGKGVNIYNSAGEKIEHIDVPENWTANVCFGGRDKNILFITASKSVYIIEMQVKGIE
ncbi:SMP-30/gluconolactonase/LRE family protein [Parafilimonas sp.]|uniref:SMP-30/gluconolactonase/LRE family protein n=1 Tax=Parafilimonas sp. TaxID=1969739 RepID=UPI0039E41BE4